MFLTIQIVNYNSREYLRDCLSSLGPFLSKNYNEAEIIIINNDAEPIGDFLNTLTLPNFNLKVIELNKNYGFGKAHNKGFLRADGEFVLFLNPDAEVMAGSIEKMLDVFEADERVGIVGPSLVDFDGKIQEDCYGFRKTPLSTIKSRFPKSDVFLKKGDFFEVDWVSGGAMLARKKLFSDLGGFDEEYFMYFEDVDLCLQAKKRGWKIVARPTARVRHRCGKSFSSNQEKKKHYYVSQNYYLKKNFGRWQARLIRLIRIPFYIKNIYFNK